MLSLYVTSRCVTLRYATDFLTPIKFINLLFIQPGFDTLTCEYEFYTTKKISAPKTVSKFRFKMKTEVTNKVSFFSCVNAKETCNFHYVNWERDQLAHESFLDFTVERLLRATN